MKDDSGIEKILIDVKKYLSMPAQCECGGQYIYQGLGNYKCEFCGSIYKNEYAIVRDFVDKYGTNYSIFEIAEMTNVPKRIIDLFVKDGKFIAVPKQRMCIICKEPIESGTYCNRCALRQIQDSFDTKRRPISSGLVQKDMRGEMHYGRNADKRKNIKKEKGD